MSNPQALPSSTTGRRFSWKSALTGAAAIIAIIAGAVPNVEKILDFTCDRFKLLCVIKSPPKVLPTAQAVRDVPKSFANATASFVRDGDRWTEFGANGQPKFHFVTSVVDDDFVYIIDTSRLRNDDQDQPLTIRIPLKGGMSQWGYPNTFQWNDLYPLQPS